MTGLGNKAIFARNLKKYMEMFNKDRNDMVKALGFKYTTFNDWYNGKTYPRIDNIEKIANYFGIAKADLIEDVDESDRTSKYPATFTDPVQAREYLSLHQIFGSDGFNVTKLDDEEVIEFANEVMKQMELISYKFKK